MKTFRSSIALGALFAALALSACSGNDEAEVAGDGDSAGEVLEGSISDAMLPLTEVRSAAPPADPVPDSGEGGSAGPSASATNATAAESAPDATPSPPSESAETPESPAEAD